MDEIYDQVPINSLYILEQQFVEEKCGILHCSMDKIVPLGSSDGKWPKYSCDRLIEALKKYPYVYLSKTVCSSILIKLQINSIFLVGEEK